GTRSSYDQGRKGYRDRLAAGEDRDPEIRRQPEALQSKRRRRPRPGGTASRGRARLDDSHQSLGTPSRGESCRKAIRACCSRTMTKYSATCSHARWRREGTGSWWRTTIDRRSPWLRRTFPATPSSTSSCREDPA